MDALPILEPLDAEEAKQQALVFKALADPNRLRLLSVIKASSSGATCVCDLTEALELSQPTVSHHLKVLVEAGLLEREKRGTWAYFSLLPEALDSVAGILSKL
jgi:ArsR family transcriptional regulator